MPSRNKLSSLAAGLFMTLAGCADDPAGVQPDASAVEPSFSIMSADAAQLSSGFTAACVISGGVLRCLDPSAGSTVRVSSSGSYLQVSAGLGHVCAVRSDGVVDCWGSDGNGQAPANRAAGTGTFTQVAGGTAHSCALRADGVIECWGSNNDGQAPAMRTATAGTFTQVVAGHFHTCALRSDGAIECWGGNFSDEAPALKTAAAGIFTQVSATYRHTCGLRSDGAIECWGNDADGQAPALKVAALRRFAHVGAGRFHTCAVRTDGVAECWGSNAQGEAPATRAPATGKFVQIAGGGYHTCALRRNGTAECWATSPYDISMLPGEPLLAVNQQSNTQVELTPYTASGYETYQIDRRTWNQAGGSWGPWERIGESWWVWGATMLDNQVLEGNRYGYRMRGCNFAGCSAFVKGSAAVTTADAPQSAPEGFRTRTISEAEIYVRWTEDMPPGTDFQLQRRTWDAGTSSFGEWTSLVTLDFETGSYADVSVTSGNRYQYRLRMCNLAGCSAYAVAPYTVTDLSLPNAPANVFAIPVSGVTVEWIDQADNKSGFQMQRRAMDDGDVWGPWEWIDMQDVEEFFVDQNLPFGRTVLQYRMRACNDAGCSAWSAGNILDLLAAE